MNRFFEVLEAEIGLLDVAAGQEVAPGPGERHPPVLEHIDPVGQVQ
jgi:hypothetical protein